MFSKLCICNSDSVVSSLEQLRREKKPQISSYHEGLKQKVKRLQQKDVLLRNRISQELDRAKGFIKSQNQHAAAAVECLKRKKYYEAQLEQLGRLQLLIEKHEQELSKLLPSVQGGGGSDIN